MATASNATPLIALDAIVIDTETTGLDPAKARIIEIITGATNGPFPQGIQGPSLKEGRIPGRYLAP